MFNDFVLPIRREPLAFKFVHENVEREAGQTCKVRVDPVLVRVGVKVECNHGDLLCSIDPFVRQESLAGMLPSTEIRVREDTSRQDRRMTSGRRRSRRFGF